MAKEFKVPVGVPRLTTTEMNALANPQKGWQVYDITTDDPKYYNGSAWVVSGAGGGGGGHVIQEEGSPLTQRAKLNFIGDAVEATDDAGNDATKVTIDSVAHYREFYVAGTGKDNYTGSLTVIDTLASYVNNGKRLRVLINGQVLTPVTHYVETSATKVTLNDALDADDDIQLEWLDSAVGLTTPTPGTHRQEDYVAGTPLDNYTGSLTVIDLVNIYAQDGKTLRVAVNGSVQTVTLGYNETGPSQITFTSPLASGTDKVSIWWVSDATNAVSYTPATQVNEDFVATAGQTDFPLANSTSGYLPLVFVDGIIQRSGYSYPSPTLLKFDDGLDLGQPVLVWFIKQTGNMGYMQEQIYEVEATADQKVFNIPWVFAVGYASLLVFHEGVKMSGGGDSIKNDYFESSNKQITFYDGRGLDEKVAFYAKNRLAVGDSDTVDSIHASATPVANKLLALDGLGKFPASVTPVGQVVQVVKFSTSTYIAASPAIPVDSSAPLSSEGTELMTLSITPKSATNILFIEVFARIGVTISNSLIIFLVQDAGANSISTMVMGSSPQTFGHPSVLLHSMVAGTTSPTTFKLRGGPSSGTMYFNGWGGAARFGGTTISTIRITEIAA